MSQKTAILITGMHRSGTSALARAVSLLGAKLADELVPANAGNPEGHWEPKAVVALNDAMLADAGSDVYAIADFVPSWFETPRAAQFTSEAIDLLKRSYGDDPFIVIKDPRTALFLPIWEQALSALDYRSVHILPMRSPRAVAASLRSRHLKDFAYDGWAAPRGELVWLRYTLAALRGTRTRPRSILRYEALLDDWRAEAERIAQETGIVWPRLGSAEAERQIDDFLHEGTRRESAGSSRAVNGPLYALTPTALADALFTAVSSAGDDAATVDAIADEFARRTNSMRELIAAFEGLYPVVWEYHEQARRTGEQIDALQRTEAGMHRAVQDMWSNLTRQTGDKSSLRQSLDTAIERGQSLERALERQAQDFAAEREELIKLADALRGLLDQELALRTDAERGREELRGQVAELDRLLAVEVAKRQDAENRELVLQTEASALRGHADALEHTLARVRRSWSWRLTGPLRVLIRGARQLAGRA